MGDRMRALAWDVFMGAVIAAVVVLLVIFAVRGEPAFIYQAF